MKNHSRRSFNRALAGLTGFAATGNLAVACSQAASAELPAGSKEKKLGIALVGLGRYSEFQLAPSLLETSHCYLAGIVTGTVEKVQPWQQKYKVPLENVYNYENFDTIVDNPAIDIVYVVLPNAMHADFCIRAARAGKHVICEKPMAVSVEECDAIIKACERAGVKLQVGYRLHYEPYTQEIQRMVQEKTFGNVRFVSADAAYHSKGGPDQWRLNKALSGGGALMNMGVYAIQSAIYSTGQNPTSVSAQEFSTRPDYFKETDETITAQFTFPNGAVGNIYTSHNSGGNRLYASCDEGWFELSPANNYGPLHGTTSAGNEIKFEHRRQQGLQMDGFARHILFDEKNLTPGEMGKRDMIIVEAIYQSIQEGGKRIELDLGQMGIV